MVRWNHTPVSDELVAAIQDTEGRAFLIEADSRRPRIIVDRTVPKTASLATDLEAINALFEAGQPGLVMVRLLDEAKTLGGISEIDWALLCFVPEDAATGKKLKTEGLHESLKEHFEAQAEPLRLKSIHFSDKFGDLAKAFIERANPRTKSIAARFDAEQELQKARLLKKLTEVELQAARVKFAIGLVSLEVEPTDSFKFALALVLQEEKGFMCVKLEGESSERLVSEEVLHDVTTTQELHGRTPDTPCYFVTFEKKVRKLASGREEEEKTLLLITWLPEDADPRLKVIYSSTKASVLAVLVSTAREAECELSQAEVASQDELKHDLNITEVEIAEVAAPRPRKSVVLATGDLGTQSAPMEQLGSTKSTKKRNPKYRRSTYKLQRSGLDKALAAQGPSGDEAPAAQGNGGYPAAVPETKVADAA